MTATATHLVRDHCLAIDCVDAPVGEGGRYGRMLDLPALSCDETPLHRLGAGGSSSPVSGRGSGRRRGPIR